MRPRCASAARLARPCARLAPSVDERALQHLGIGRHEIRRRERIDVLPRHEREAAAGRGSGSARERRELGQVFADEQVALLQQREVGQLAPLAARRSGDRRRRVRDDFGQRIAPCPRRHRARPPRQSASQRARYLRVERGERRRRRCDRPGAARIAARRSAVAGAARRRPQAALATTAPIRCADRLPSARRARRRRRGRGVRRHRSGSVRHGAPMVTRTRAPRHRRRAARLSARAATCASAMTAMPSPISASCFAVSSGSGPPVQARDEVGDRDVEQARRGDREHRRQHLLHVGQREVAGERADQRGDADGDVVGECASSARSPNARAPRSRRPAAAPRARRSRPSSRRRAPCSARNAAAMTTPSQKLWTLVPIRIMSPERPWSRAVRVQRVLVLRLVGVVVVLRRGRARAATARASRAGRTRAGPRARSPSRARRCRSRARAAGARGTPRPAARRPRTTRAARSTTDAARACRPRRSSRARRPRARRRRSASRMVTAGGSAQRMGAATDRAQRAPAIIRAAGAQASSAREPRRAAAIACHPPRSRSRRYE